MKMEKNIKKILFIVFFTLYLSVGFVSTYHAITFFSLANQHWLAIILAISFELGQSAALLSLIVLKSKKSIMPWILMIILTSVQIMGNVFSSYKYLMEHNPQNISFFQESILFGITGIDMHLYYVIVVWIVGALLPIVTLGITGLIAENLFLNKISKSDHLKENKIIKTTNKRKTKRKIK